MARKKRKKKEPFEFKAPEFDEVEFMKREVEGAKAAMITIVYAFAVALASWALTLAGVASLGGLLGLAAVYGLRYVYPLAGVDLSRFDWKLWAGNGAIHLFAWFAFWVLLLNPPFLDVSPPVIHNLAVPGGDPVNLAADEFSALSLGGATSFQVLANVTDNQQLADVRISVVVGGGEQPGGQMTFTGNGAEWSFTVDPAEPGRTYTLTIDAVDRAGHRSSSDFIVATS
ncbi:MAG: Ig-like domain-containing protein [Thermoplasmata archaeon]